MESSQEIWQKEIQTNTKHAAIVLHHTLRFHGWRIAFVDLDDDDKKKCWGQKLVAAS